MCFCHNPHNVRYSANAPNAIDSMNRITHPGETVYHLKHRRHGRKYPKCDAACVESLSSNVFVCYLRLPEKIQPSTIPKHHNHEASNFREVPNLWRNKLLEFTFHILPIYSTGCHCWYRSEPARNLGLSFKAWASQLRRRQSMGRSSFHRGDVDPWVWDLFAMVLPRLVDMYYLYIFWCVSIHTCPYLYSI